jgi:NAD+ synthetase
MKKTFDTLVKKTEDYIIRNGLKSMVLGISGGIDSTVCAAICREISDRSSGKIQFIGISLPSRTNETEEVSAADLVGEVFCNEFYKHYIEEDYETIRKGVNLRGNQTPIADGNIKARLRMIYLYNMASIRKGIVIDTDNLSEHYLGFWTIHGDEGDLNPIGDLWKHEIYELARWISKTYMESGEEDKIKRAAAIDFSSKLVPTDGNGVMAGGDMAQIAPGLTYNEVDTILEVIKNCEESYQGSWRKTSFNRLVDKGLIRIYGSELINKILDRVMGSQFKRRKRPVVIRL